MRLQPFSRVWHRLSGAVSASPQVAAHVLVGWFVVGIGWFFYPRSVACVGPRSISCMALPSLAGPKIILTVCGLLCFSTYLLPPNSSLSSEMESSMRLRGPFAFSGFHRSIGPGRLIARPSSSSSPEMHLLSSPCEIWTDPIGEPIRFIVGAFVLDAGGGAVLLLDASAFFIAMSFSTDRFCCRTGLLLVHAS